MNEIKIVYVPIADLKMSEYNPRKITIVELENIKNSIMKFGIVDPIIVNCAKNRKNIIIGGCQRYKTFKKLNFKEVPVVYVNIDDLKKEKELNLRLNGNTGNWDLEMLKLIDFDIRLEANLSNALINLSNINNLDENNNIITEMELKPLEKYDYIVLLFSNIYDFENAQEKFGIKKIQIPFKNKVGLGRIINGGKFLNEHTIVKKDNNKQGKK